MDCDDHLDVCFICGGPVERIARPGCIRNYRDMTGFEIPADLAVPTCRVCGATWLEAADLEALEAIFALQREARLQATARRLAIG
jgi:hypothetical protein